MKGFTHESTNNESKEWYTPKYIFDALGIKFDLDPCSPGKDIVSWIPAERHLTMADDGLSMQWHGNVFINPPYGNDTPAWLAKLSKHGQGIALVFARTDTRWFHNYVSQSDAICFLKGRVHFVPAKLAREYASGLIAPTGSCGAGSMLVAYGRDNALAIYKSGLGLTLERRKVFEAARLGHLQGGQTGSLSALLLQY